MKSKAILLIFSLFLFTTSCEPEDDYVQLNVEVNPDSITVNQNESVEIFMLENDLNITDSGNITISMPSKGTVVINDNNTPNDTSDDSLIYTAGANKVGEDNFQYSVCDDVNTCNSGTVTVTIISISNVNYNLEAFPYQTLSDYNFFQGDLKDLVPNYGVLPYSLNSSLFTDYAKKKRFVWLPNNTSANFVDDNSLLDFPVGTILIKNFYYTNVLPDNSTKIIETRLMIKKPEGWVFAEYVWNDEQTEANLDLEGSFVNIEWEQNQEVKNIQYRIPNQAECVTCHKVNEVPFPIGTKPRNLNLVNLYEGNMQNQLDKLKDFGYLEDLDTSSSVSSTPDYTDTTVPLEDRARAYLDINCAHCHIDLGHCDYRPIRLDYTSTLAYENLGVCVTPDENLGGGLVDIITPGNSRSSVLHFRINSTEESNRMPLLGRTIVHKEGVDLIEEWIDGLTLTCD